MPNKYGARKTYSVLCGRQFDSKWECQRAEELELMRRAGEISDLQYQVKYVLCTKPRITVTIDFAYHDVAKAQWIYEDAKGVLTRDSRTKYAWLREKHGIAVRLARK